MYIQFSLGSNFTIPTIDEAAKLTFGLLSWPLILLKLGPELAQRRELIFKMVLLRRS